MKWLNSGISKALLFLLLPLSAYFYLAYFYERTQFEGLLYVLPFLAGSYLITLFFQQGLNWKVLFAIGMLFRLTFLFSLPALSDDFYRFLWDGILFQQDVDPYASLPSEMTDLSGFQKLLLSKMNSPDYFSVYPPLLQYFFGLAAGFGSDSLLGSVLFFRLLIILAEVGSFFLLRKILTCLKLSRSRAFIYFLNPLVIIELSGNLHPEAFWIFLFVLTIYLIIKQRWLSSGAAFAAAVLVKLMPLLFLPLLVKRLSRTSVWFLSAALGCTILVCLPLIHLNTFLQLFDSIDLYFRNFEFNASVYYLLRGLGFQYLGYNPIQYLGPLLGVLTAVLILFMQLRRGGDQWSTFFKRLLLSLSIYYLFAQVVHPWYLAPLVLLACFQTFLFPILWSIVIFLSYHRYAEGVTEEHWGILLAEYLPLYVLLAYELTAGQPLWEGFKKKVFKLSG